MDRVIYEGHNIEECIEQAVKEFNLPKEVINYKVLENKGIFKKKVKAEFSIDKEKADKLNGEAEIINGKINIKSPLFGGQKAALIPTSKVILIVNGKIIKEEEKVYVTGEDQITVSCEEIEAKRNFSIDTDENNIKAYGEIRYVPKVTYRLKDKSFSKELKIETEISKEECPPAFTKDEIINFLNDQKIIYGIKEENIDELISAKESKRILIAEGEEKIDGINDKINILYNTGDNFDINEKIDFRKRNNINNVQVGQIIGEKILGQDGQDGMNIFGKVLPHKKAVKKSLIALKGCIVKDNRVVSLKKGRPYFKNNGFYVEEVYEVNSNVDMKTGNVDFIGGIDIKGSISEGMEVNAGGYVSVEGGIDSAKITSKGDIFIKGNVLNSNIEAGGKEARKSMQIDVLRKFSNNIKSLIETVEEIKNHSLLGQNRTDGEIIKVLLENKFKNVNKYYIKLINFNVIEKGKFEDIINLIKKKLIGLAPISIKHYSELNEIINKIDSKIQELEKNIDLEVNVQLNYVQDSTIISSNSIIINGKGMYTSELLARNSIYFINPESVARGGILSAEKEIKCQIVGSTGQVKTTLKVGKKGHIWVEKAYANTKFVVGERECILDEPSKKIEVYLDNSGEIVLDKFKL